MLVESDCSRCVCLYVCVLFVSELVLSCPVWSPLKLFDKLCPSTSDSADTSLCLFVSRLLCVAFTQGHPELSTTRYQITSAHKHTHTHLPRLQNHLSNFRDDCQVCAAGGKKERRKDVERFHVNYKCESGFSLLVLSLKDTIWVRIKHKRTWWVSIKRVQSCRHIVDLH